MRSGTGTRTLLPVPACCRRPPLPNAWTLPFSQRKLIHESTAPRASPAPPRHPQRHPAQAAPAPPRTSVSHSIRRSVARQTAHSPSDSSAFSGQPPQHFIYSAGKSQAAENQRQARARFETGDPGNIRATRRSPRRRPARTAGPRRPKAGGAIRRTISGGRGELESGSSAAKECSGQGQRIRGHANKRLRIDSGDDRHRAHHRERHRLARVTRGCASPAGSRSQACATTRK